VGDQRDSGLRASVDDSPAACTIVEHAEPDLDRRHGRKVKRFIQLTAVDVRQPDAPHHAFVHQPSERADRCSPRRPWIGGMDQVEVDRDASERSEARFAVAVDCLRASVRQPAPIRSRHAALRHDARLPLGATAPKRAG